MMSRPSLANSRVPQPTQAMLDFFVSRTTEHIGRVAKSLDKVSEHPDFIHLAPQLQERGALHDASKFREPERLPCVWMTEFHRCKQAGVPFSYPPGVQEVVGDSIQLHITRNAHHPEAHSSPNAMSEIDTIEMVCDWRAMDHEKGTGREQQRVRAAAVIERRGFDAQHTALIYRIMDLLDACEPF